MATLAAAKEWLGGEHGEPARALPEALQEVLEKGFKEGIWTMDDTPGEDEDVAEQWELWIAVFEDSAKEKGVTLGKSDFVRFKRWFYAHFEGVDEVDGTSYTPSKAHSKKTTPGTT